MSSSRIKAVLLEELFITRHSLEVIVDLFLMSVMSALVFGLFSVFLSSSLRGPASHYLLLGMLLWEVVRVTQYSISIGAMWEVWSHNLTNLFVTPMRFSEYLTAAMISGAVKSLVILVTVSLIAAVFFDFSILSIGVVNLVLGFINLWAFGVSLGLAVLGVIFRYGTRIQALAWGTIFLFQPLTAVYFPVDTLPPALRAVALCFPPTYVFQMARDGLSDKSTQWDQVLVTVLLNVVYLALSLAFFSYMHRTSRSSGQFAKLGV